MFWKTTVTTLDTGRTNNKVSTIMFSTGLCLGVGGTVKLADKTASNLSSLCEMLATWSDTFSSEYLKTLIFKARIITASIKLSTESMLKLFLMNGIEYKFLGEPLTTEAQVVLPKETGQDMGALSKHMTTQWAYA
ncbi:hypothetical protein G9A89_018898 [Geosiphon pyriformis]|nr:hypothetical protein G9A89_018898 [Geosiphon pyriformis]